MRSFRARLTLWNVAVMTVMLVAFAATIVYGNQARLSAEIDRELVDRALHAPPPPPRGPGRGRGPMWNLPGEQENRPQISLPPRFSDPAAIRFADVRRPRRFGADGSPLGAMQDGPFDVVALTRARQGRSGFSDGTFESRPIRIYSHQIQRGPDAGQVIQVARETSDLSQIWSAQMGTLLIILPIAIGLAAIGAVFLTARATRPLAQMKRAAESITEQDLSKRLQIEGRDEFAELGGTLNSMIARLEASFGDLRQAFETQKRFTADASHELRTPLTRLRLATSSALAPDATDEDRRKALEIADRASQTMGRLVQEMLVLARADAGQLAIHREAIDLRVLAADVVDAFPADDRIRVDLPQSPVTIEGDADHLHRVLANLVENAMRYTPPAGSITVSVESGPSGAALRVADTGSGIAAEHLPHLTERFYRIDESRSRDDGGCGLGLAICKTIMDAHGGTMRIESTLGTGTAVTLTFPKSVPNQTKSS